MEEIIMNLKEKEEVYFLFNEEGEFLETRSELSRDEFRHMGNTFVLFYLPSWILRDTELDNESKNPYLVYVHPYEEPLGNWTGVLAPQAEKISVDKAPAQLRAWMLINN